MDITVHEVTDRDLDTKGKEKVNFIKEIHKARGNDMGGTKVDDEFLKYLESLFGKYSIEFLAPIPPSDEKFVDNLIFSKKLLSI